MVFIQRTKIALRYKNKKAKHKDGKNLDALLFISIQLSQILTAP